MVSFKSVTVAVAAFASTSLAVPFVRHSKTGSDAHAAYADATAKGQSIPGSYIVTLKDGTNTDVDSHIRWVKGIHARSINKRGARGVSHEYKGNFKGYAGSFDDNTVAEIRKHADVAKVEEDKIWNLAFTKDTPAEDDETHLFKRRLTREVDAPYGLATVSHRRPGFNTYIYNTLAGQNTFAYIIDSGIRASHTDFEGRAVQAYTAFENSNDDNLGHGTHVAGTIGSKTYGVAKKANLLAVKVFEDGGSATSIILDGYNWAVNDITSKGRASRSVINMSLGGPPSDAFDSAIENAAQAGVLTVVAAGNAPQDAAEVSPARAPSAITVGAIDKDWNFASDYSNFGSVLDILAPGTDVLSTWNTDDDATNVISGTSMASPHVAGLALYAISVDGIIGVDAISTYLVAIATDGQAKGDLKGSPNKIANNDNPWIVNQGSIWWGGFKGLKGLTGFKGFNGFKGLKGLHL